MDDEISFGVYVPSYSRYDDKVRMYEHLDNCTYVVRKSEEPAYRAHGIDRLWVIEDEKIDSLHKVFQYIIENSPEDLICLVDDDGKFAYRNIESRDMTSDEASMEIARIAQLMYDLRIGYAITDAIPAPFYYTSEFEFKGPSGGCHWVNKTVFKAKIDPECMYNFDLDLELQELLANRVVLRPKYFLDVGGQDTNKGGSNTDKSNAKRLAGITHTKAKWGKYFDYNLKTNKASIVVRR